MIRNLLLRLVLCLSLFIVATNYSYSQFSLLETEEFKLDLLNKMEFQSPRTDSGLMTYLKPQHSYHPTLGKFCVLENKIAKKTRFPVKMRLGSVDYVDKLENKRN